MWKPVVRVLKSYSPSSRRELVTLVLLLVVFAAGWSFFEIAGEVLEGDTQVLDRRVVLSMREASDLSDPLGPRWLEEFGRDVTALGGMGILGFFALLTVGYLFLDRKPHAALFVLVAVFGGMLLSTVLKEVVDRPRPDLVPHGQHVYTKSFPSGHSMLSAVTYLTLGALLARLQKRRRLKLYLLLLAVFLSLAIGMSRVYLGVHWPTDVLAGWSAGAAWAVLCWVIARALQQRGRVEREPEVSE
jgi:undecaprenyl-diphosphatase